MNIIKIDSDHIEVNGKRYVAEKEKYRKVRTLTSLEPCLARFNVEITSSDVQYFNSLARIRAVIRENKQECKRYDGIGGYFIVFPDGCFYGCRFSTGEIVVKNQDFGDWLISNYSNDLKILAGAE